MKICTKCLKTKELGCFSKCSKTTSGLAYYCKTCVQTVSQKYREKRKQYSKEVGYNKNYYNNYKSRNRETVLLNGARARAKRYNILFSLTKEDIVIPERCPIFDTLLRSKEEICAETKKGAQDNSLSLDRIDPTKGYTKGNVAVISYRANVIKNNGSAEEHRRIAEWMDKVGR